MVKSYTKEKKKRNLIKTLKEELDQNKKTVEANTELLKQKVKLIKANKDMLEFEKRSYTLHTRLLEIEIKHPKVLTPLMEFHNDPEWQKAFNELHQLELESVQKQWDGAQLNFKNQEKQTNKMIDETEISKQQDRISARTPEIIEQLKNLGEKVEIEKQDYIG